MEVLTEKLDLYKIKSEKTIEQEGDYGIEYCRYFCGNYMASVNCVADFRADSDCSVDSAVVTSDSEI